MTSSFGILSVGAYLPRARMQRKAVAAANGWFAPGLKGLGKGERTIGNWDEDTITMAVEAARDCLGDLDRTGLKQLVLASTTHPFDDRQNATVVATALHLPSALRTSDAAGSLRAGTGALIAALEGRDRALVIASDMRRAKAGSTQEMQYGDGAAAVLVGEGTPLATLVGSHTESVDFVHQYRMHDRNSDYGWEERWIRDEGYLKLVPRAVGALLKRCGVEPSAVAHFVMPGTLSKVQAAVAKKCGFAETAVRDPLGATVGDTGAAHPLLMLAAALDDAKPGDKVLVAGFGEGCDVLLLEVGQGASAAKRGFRGALADRREESNYMRWLSFTGTIDLERGMRAEVDKATAMTVLYRNRDMIEGLVGGKCRSCGTVQFPRQRYCVNPACNALDSQDDYVFSERTGKVLSYTADGLTYSPDPPTYFGMVQVDGGGRMLMDFTEVDPASMDVGLPVKMVFRIKDADPNRGFVRYFWKAAPARG
ncbi:MAG: OB-fold domain-containing protein [Burkholderiales bacterium]